MKDPRILGLGEYMNFRGVIDGAEAELDKLLVAIRAGKLIDGHCPGVTGKALNAYAAAGIATDHECTTVEELQERIDNGMYVQLRQGSASRELVKLLKGVTPFNSRRCVLCSDDRQPKTIFEEGHLDGHLRICVREGIDPITAIQMVTINAAECYGLSDRGAIVPGRRADLVFVDDLKDFRVNRVLIAGEPAAREGRYLPEVTRTEIAPVAGSVKVKDFDGEKLKLHLTSGKVRVIDVVPGSILTRMGTAQIALDGEGDFVYRPGEDICKAAVIERHKGTGSMALGLIRGYGIHSGAAAITVAHDSHNIIAAGVNNRDLELAVRELVRQQGGAVLVKDGRVLEVMPLPVGGIMSDQSGEWVDAKLVRMHRLAREELGISDQVDPFMTLCFLALPAIPELRLTDQGLFDVTRFGFTDIGR